MCRTRAAILSANRSYMDDAAIAGILEQRQERLYADERAFEVCVQDRIPVRIRHIIEISGLVFSGVVNEDRDRSKLFCRSRRFFDACAIGHIHRKAERTAPKRRDLRTCYSGFSGIIAI